MNYFIRWFVLEITMILINLSGVKYRTSAVFLSAQHIATSTRSLLFSHIFRYCGLEKDVVILRKIYEEGTPLQWYVPCIAVESWSD